MCERLDTFFHDSEKKVLERFSRHGAVKITIFDEISPGRLEEPLQVKRMISISGTYCLEVEGFEGWLAADYRKGKYHIWRESDTLESLLEGL